MRCRTTTISEKNQYSHRRRLISTNNIQFPASVVVLTPLRMLPSGWSWRRRRQKVDVALDRLLRPPLTKKGKLGGGGKLRVLVSITCEYEMVQKFSAMSWPGNLFAVCARFCCRNGWYYGDAGGLRSTNRPPHGLNGGM